MIGAKAKMTTYFLDFELLSLLLYGFSITGLRLAIARDRRHILSGWVEGLVTVK